MSPRVLLVEDNPDHRTSLRFLLEAWGFPVQEASDGQEGVRKALAWRPEAAVVDIGLPLCDGYEVARRVKHALGDDIVLIALTAYGAPEDRRRAFEAGFAHHLTKPADPEELHRLLDVVPNGPKA
jgi:CheY-like chemotaxis protein